MSTSTVPYTCPFSSSKSSTPRTCVSSLSSRSVTASTSRSTVASCTSMPYRPFQPRRFRQASSSPNPASMRRQLYTTPPLPFSQPPFLLYELTALQASFRQLTISPSRLSAPSSLPPRHQPPISHTRRAPAPTPDRTAPHAASARQDATITTASPASSTPCTLIPARCGNSTPSRAFALLRDIPETRAAELASPAASCQTDPSTGLPRAALPVDHRVINGASLPAHAAAPRISQIVTIQAPAAAATKIAALSKYP